MEKGVNMGCETSAGHFKPVTVNPGETIGEALSKEIPEVKRHPNSARFHEILKELGDLHDRKQADYGRGDDPFANVRASSDWGVPGWVGALIRGTDKLRRLQSLISNGKLQNESAEDSLRDLAVYAIIALVLFEQEKK